MATEPPMTALQISRRRFGWTADGREGRIAKVSGAFCQRSRCTAYPTCGSRSDSLRRGCRRGTAASQAGLSISMRPRGEIQQPGKTSEARNLAAGGVRDLLQEDLDVVPLDGREVERPSTLQTAKSDLQLDRLPEREDAAVVHEQPVGAGDISE